jgi:hypothetical protein
MANLDPLRALSILRVPGTVREPELKERQLDAQHGVRSALQAIGGISSPAGSCVWHVVGLQRSVQEWRFGKAGADDQCGKNRPGPPGGGVGRTRVASRLPGSC